VFLMDEPMSHLDAQLRGHMRAELRHIQKQTGVTSIFVTHDQLEAMTMADRIMVMRDGRMLQFARPLEIFERPSDEFVATFVGEPHMNVMGATLRRSGNGLVADTGSFVVPLSPRSNHELGRWEGRAVRLGIRPEHVRLAGAVDEDHGIEAELYSFEPTGAENLYVLRAGDIEVTTRSSTTETAHLGKQEGTRIAMHFDPNWIYLFDPENGRTIGYAVASESHLASAVG
jgi:multiple sugar transport system ATP-binding protein